MKRKQSFRRSIARTAFAIIFVTFAAALRMWPLHIIGSKLPWLTFYPAVVLAAVIGGLSAGLLTTGLACLAVVFLWPLFVTEPFVTTKSGWMGMSVFILIGSVISGVSEAMRRIQARAYMYQTLVESMDEGFCVVEMLYDSTGKPVDYRFVVSNAAFEAQTGLDQAKGKTIRQMVPDHDAHWFDTYGKVARTGEPIRFENPATAIKKYFEVFAYRVGGDGSNRVGILFKDITERKISEQELITSALYDKLTGLANRTMFRDYLTKALARAERVKHPLALLFLDLDGFKAVNDTLGHQAGDNLLRAIAQRLLSCVRAGDLVSRLGGDEFTIILENCPPNHVPAFAEKILRVLEAPVDLEGHAAQLSASIGIVTYPECAASEETLIQRADAAMYAVKKDGKKGYQLWHSSDRNTQDFPA